MQKHMLSKRTDHILFFFFTVYKMLFQIASFKGKQFYQNVKI